MIRIGAHVSTAGGLEKACIRAKEIGATAFALFTKNPKSFFGSSLSKESIDAFVQARKKEKYPVSSIVPHEGYLVNLGNPDEDKREKSFRSFLDELHRCEQLGLGCLNIHPGSRLKEKAEERCMDHITAGINEGLRRSKKVKVLLEITAGQGTNVGYSFSHLRYMIDAIEDKDRIGVCYDTCHAFAAGYNIRTKNAFESTFEEFDRIIGLEYLSAIHLNDAKRELGSKIDRHETLGSGQIGWDGFRFFVQDSRFDEIPMILETPEPELWPEEIRLLYSFVK